MPRGAQYGKPLQLTIILISNYHATKLGTELAVLSDFEVLMYVCVCHAVTDKDIRKAVDGGARSLFDVQNELPVGSCCGRCEDTAESVVNEYLRSQSRDAGCRLVPKVTALTPVAA